MSATPSGSTTLAKNNLTLHSFWSYLKGLFHPAFFVRVVFWLAFVVAIFMGHYNIGKPRDRTCKACWMKQTLKVPFERYDSGNK